MKDGALLVMEGMHKSFTGVKALSDARLTVKAGTVHALMGENGAGKSTLMKCLFGIYRADAGRILLEGREVCFQSAKEALVGGVAMVHQELNQALKLSVMDNMYLGRMPRAFDGAFSFLPFTSEKKLYDGTRAIFSELGIDVNPRMKMGELSVSRRQMVEIARAVSYGAKVIVFDEPTSSLNETEAEKLFEIIAMLKTRGCGIIYISHKMDEILRISDEITVMRDGEYVRTLPADKTDVDEIIRLMVGRELRDRYPKKENATGGELLRVRGLASREAGIEGISFELMEGEILGIAGLDGAGRTELLKSLFGLYRIDEGKITLSGREIRNTEPVRAIRNGFALVGEERRADGIFPILSIMENTVISSLEKFHTGPLLSKNKMLRATNESIKRLRIKTPDAKTKIENLSGGNQQKVIIGRWLLTEPRVIMMDEPTRGIDVGAKYEIYKLMLDFAKGGGGVIMVSSEMGELLGVCDRILVLSAGRLSGVLSRAEATQEKIMKLAARYV